jgi:hypothetical protein
MFDLREEVRDAGHNADYSRPLTPELFWPIALDCPIPAKERLATQVLITAFRAQVEPSCEYISLNHICQNPIALVVCYRSRNKSAKMATH